MNDHLNELEVARLADGEDANDAHVRDCARCANAVVAAMQMKRAVREAMPRYEYRRRRAWTRVAPAIAAAIAILAILGSWFVVRRDSARDFADLHTTIVGSANPIDVVSTDRHTVKPWFEGRVPFAVDVPELTGTPFRLAGGRVVFWRGRPVAYLLVTKGAHRISLFIGEHLPGVQSGGPMSIESWRANGLDYVAVADLPRSDLEALRGTFEK